MNNVRINAPARVLSIILIISAVLLFRYQPDLGIVPPWLLSALLVLAAVLLPLSLLMAQQWEKAVVLRLGKLHAIRGPGLFVVIPIVDTVTVWIDQRIQTTEFNAEQALTRDTVPANIDAILFWQVHDPERAALEITDYRQAILRVAQTSLREMIGSSPLSALLAERKIADQQLKEEIGRKTADWGVAVISVEIRDVAIPAQLQDAMSRQAQAEREKAARVILASAEQDIAQRFLDAANIYAQNPAALQLRAMNIIYETTKERGSTILIPTAMVDSMNAGNIMGVAAFASQVPPVPPIAPAPAPAGASGRAPSAPPPRGD
jgi:regulator of protease activity HflC (stomatin/prohibitin superfamily)